MKLVVIANDTANGGAGARRFAAVKATEIGRALGLAAAPRYAGGFVADPERRTRELAQWLGREAEHGELGVIACGGDGTVNLVTSALMRLAEETPSLARRCVLGAIGVGSSNDFHKPFATTHRRLCGDVPLRLEFAAATLHDVGVMDTDACRAFFINNVSVGLAASANADFNRQERWRRALKRLSVDSAILYSAMRTWAGYANLPVTLHVDGQAPRQSLLTNLTVAKNVHFSGNFRYDVAVSSASGTFGVFLCEAMSRVASLRALAALGRGQFNGRPGTSWAHAASVGLTAAAEFPVEADGEIWRTRRLDVRIAANALRVCP